MKRYALDTSALLTLRDNEPGAERVAEVLHLAAKGNGLLLAPARIAQCWYIKIQNLVCCQ